MARSIFISDSEHGEQKGQHVRVHQIAVRANISKIKSWIGFYVLSPFAPATRIGALGRRCINDFCKAGYDEGARQQLVDDAHVAVAISKARTNRDLARFPGPIRQCVSHLKNSLSITSRGARRPETFPKTGHLLPSAAI
jgi:hypothetical protein